MSAEQDGREGKRKKWIETHSRRLIFIGFCMRRHLVHLLECVNTHTNAYAHSWAFFASVSRANENHNLLDILFYLKNDHFNFYII